MDAETKQIIDDLKRQVSDLSEKLNSIMSNTSFPIELEHALFDRGFIKFSPVTTPALNGDTVLFQSNGEGFRIDSGSGVQVPALPYRYLILPKNVIGTVSDMYIPLYIFGQSATD